MTKKSKIFPKVPLDKRDLLTWKQKKELGREMYFNYSPITDISKEIGVLLPTVKSWVYGQVNKKDKGWKLERELSQNQLLKNLSSDKRGMVQSMVNGSLYLLHDYVEKSRMATMKSGEPISIRDAEKLTSILMNLHKIVQDESSSSDDANFTKPTSPEELKERVIKADPFSKKPDIDITEDDVILEEDL